MTGHAVTQQQPNLVLLMGDQHRADALGGSGTAEVETPHLDRLAGEGVRFDRAYCQGPLCMPARASFLTERYVRDHGVSDNNRQLAPDVTTFLQPLQSAGYHTACFGKMHLYIYPGVTDVRQCADRMHAFGFTELHETGGKGASVRLASEFTDYLEERGLRESYAAHFAAMRGGPAWAVHPYTLPLDTYPDYWLGQRVARWIEEYDRDQPFFLWAGFPGPHHPWDVPSAYADRYAHLTPPARATAPPEPSSSEPYTRFLGPRLRGSDSDTLTDERLLAVRRAYYGNVTLIDEAVGAVVAALAGRGLLDNTWVVYTADHGEMLGDHSLLHKRVFYEPSVRVPLIVRPPGGRTGTVERRIVQHIDIPATLRVIAGAVAPPGSAGRSLFEGQPRSTAFSENLGFTMAVTERWKLVVHGESRAPVALFDLANDPDENRNLVADTATAGALAELMSGEVAAHLSRPATLLPDARPEGRRGYDD
jgi:arylsulfatase